MKGEYENMKKLADLLEKLEYRCLQGTMDKEITDITFDSRKAEKGCLFFCIKGADRKSVV